MFLGRRSGGIKGLFVVKHLLLLYYFLLVNSFSFLAWSSRKGEIQWRVRKVEGWYVC